MAKYGVAKPKRGKPKHRPPGKPGGKKEGLKKSKKKGPPPHRPDSAERGAPTEGNRAG